MDKNPSGDKYQKYSQVRIEKLEEITEGVFLLSLIRSFDFIPGQVIGITDDTEIPARMYSIASGNNDPFLQVLFDVKRDGYLTPHLAGLKKGDGIFITRPYGSFVCDNSPAWWIATGTGIAPFYSMIRSGNINGKTLIQGARFPQSFYFQEQFEPVLKGNYIRCLSGQTNHSYFGGRVTAYLEQQQFLPLNQKYYLCGRAEMVVDTRDILISKGVPYEHIMAEIYF